MFNLFSLGVILWEIAGHRPAYEDVFGPNLWQNLLNLLSGDREKIVPNIPVEYQNLYKSCWNRDSLLPPDTSKIVDDLNRLVDLDIRRRKWDPGKTINTNFTKFFRYTGKLL